MYASNPLIRYWVPFETLTDTGSPVRLYVIVYETICPLGIAGGDHENKMEKDPITSGAKLSGGLPGAMAINVQ